MFLSSGNTIETVETSQKTFGKILAEYISKNFSGRISYKNIATGTYISIEIVGGVIALCRGIEKSNIIEGNICCEKATSYLHVGEGVVEVVEIDPKFIGIDMINFPNSIVEGTTSLHTQLIAITPIPRAIEAIERRAEEIIATEKAEAIEVSKTITSVASSGTAIYPTILEECIDPITLYQVIKSSQLVQQQEGSITYLDIIGNMMSIARDRKPSKIYINATTSSETLRILLDVESMKMNIEYEKEGRVECGSNAVKIVAQIKFGSTRIWIL